MQTVIGDFSLELHPYVSVFTTTESFLAALRQRFPAYTITLERVVELSPYQGLLVATNRRDGEEVRYGLPVLLADVVGDKMIAGTYQRIVESIAHAFPPMDAGLEVDYAHDLDDAPTFTEALAALNAYQARRRPSGE